MFENILLKIVFNYLIFNQTIQYQQVKNKLIKIDNHNMMIIIIIKDINIHKQMLLEFSYFLKYFFALYSSFPVLHTNQITRIKTFVNHFSIFIELYHKFSPVWWKYFFGQFIRILRGFSINSWHWQKLKFRNKNV